MGKIYACSKVRRQVWKHPRDEQAESVRRLVGEAELYLVGQPRAAPTAGIAVGKRGCVALGPEWQIVHFFRLDIRQTPLAGCGGRCVDLISTRLEGSTWRSGGVVNIYTRPEIAQDPGVTWHKSVMFGLTTICDLISHRAKLLQMEQPIHHWRIISHA